MRTVLVIVTSLSPTVVVAGDKCYYTPYTQLQPYTYYPPSEYDNTIVEVINHQSQIYPATPTVRDVKGERAFQQQWAQLLEAIPLTPRAQTGVPRTFHFVNNMPLAPAIQQRSQTSQSEQASQSGQDGASSRTQTVTHVLQGVVRQSVVVQDGVVTIDVPPAVLRQLTGP